MTKAFTALTLLKLREDGVEEMGDGAREPKPKNISPSVEQFHVGHNVLLVLQRQHDDAVTGVGKELGVVRCYLLECLGGVVMKVRSSVPASSEHRNLESIHVFQPWIIDDSRDQRTPRIGAGNPLFLRRARIEDELANRVVRRIEFGHSNAQEPLTGWNWRRRRNEGRRKFVGLVH